MLPTPQHSPTFFSDKVGIPPAGADSIVKVRFLRRLDRAFADVRHRLRVPGLPALRGRNALGIQGLGPHVMGLHLLSFVGFVVSGAFGLWLVWGIFRHGRL